MYGHELSAGEAYYGPPRQGQSFELYQSEQEQFAKSLAVGAGVVALAVAVNPLVAGAALVGWLASSGAGSGRHMNKPKTQGG